MKWRMLVVALLLLTPLGQAAAAEDPGHHSKNARKVLAALNSIGINNSGVKDFVTQVDSHVDEGYLTFSEHKVPGGTITLRYQLGASTMPVGLASGGGISKRIELHLTPDDSNWDAVARRDGAMVNYKFKF